MKYLRSNGARKERRNVAECDRQIRFKILRRLENERLARIHYLEEQVRHIALLRPALVLFFSLDHLFGKVAFALTDHDRIVAVYTEVRDDIFLPQFIIQVYQRNNPRFDKHQKREAEGNPLFAG